MITITQLSIFAVESPFSQTWSKIINEIHRIINEIHRSKPKPTGVASENVLAI